MIKQKDVVGYKNEKDFRGVVLEDVLKMFSERASVEIVKLPAHSRSQIDGIDNKKNISLIDFKRSASTKSGAKQINKLAVSDTTDFVANKIIHTLIYGKVSNLKKSSPIEKSKNQTIIKPLYLFLDKEVLLYTKLKNLEFKQEKINEDKISNFIDELEKKHPEIKRAIVKGYLELYEENINI